ncbi:hypothetical protein, partial [Azohydromonas lata]|uniref:hypothetical protein n=1 Tax=Azohydromonas lata TaxID=45677 RepID=UPI000A5B2794
ATDHLSKVGTLAVTGVESGATVSYSTNGGTTWSNSFTAAEGLNNLVVRVTDTAGNHADTAYSFTLDTQVQAPGTLVVPEAPGGVMDEELTSDGGVPVVVPFAADVRAGDVITLTVDDPTTNTPVQIQHTVTAQDVIDGHASVVIPTANLPVDGDYAVSAIVTDRAGNTSGASTGSFTVLPALVLEENCQIFNLARRAYEGTDPQASAPDADVFVVTHGLQGDVDELSLYRHEYDLYTGTELGNIEVTGVVRTGGLDINAEGALGSRHLVAGIVSAASVEPNHNFVTADTNTIWNDRVALTLDSSDNGSAAVYVVADADGSEALARAGAFDVAAHVSAQASAEATGALVAHAAGGTAQVQACDVTITAEGATGATAHLGAAVQDVSLMMSMDLPNAAGVAAVAEGDMAHASVEVHENLTVLAEADTGTAWATADAVVAWAAGSGSAANVSIGALSIEAHAAQGTATAGMGGEGDGLLVHAEGDDAMAVIMMGGLNVGALSDADMAQARLSALTVEASDGAQFAAMGIMGAAAVHAEGASGAQAVFGMVNVQANGEDTNAVGWVAAPLSVAAQAAAGTASAELSSLYALASEGGQAQLGIGTIAVTAEGSSGASATFDALYAQASSGAQAQVWIGSDIVVDAMATEGSAAASMDALFAQAGGDG